MLIINFIYVLFLVSPSYGRPASATLSLISPNSTSNHTNLGETLQITPQLSQVTVEQQQPNTSTPDATFSDIPMFNVSTVQRESKTVTAKYSKAAQYLEGEDLVTLPDFTQISAQLGNGDASSQNVGSTYVWNLQSYGNDIAYYGDINLGTPLQTLAVDVDTGSADLWVPSNCTDCGSHSQFQSGASSTYVDTGNPFSLTYGSGQVQGTIATDTVTLGPLSVDQQYFGAVSDESADFSGVPFDGIIGMAFSSIAATQQPTFMERLISSGQVNAAVFGVYLTRQRPQGSEVCIGCYDPSKYTGDIAWNRVVSKTYWSIGMNNILVNGVATSLRTVVAAIDTGTSLIYLPQDLADSVYRQIPGAKHASQYGPGLYTYPCRSRPNVSLVFGTTSYQIDLRDFNLGKTSLLGSNCVGGILGLGGGFPSNLAIVGDEFLKSWYSIYDYGHGSRVGFAKSVN